MDCKDNNATNESPRVGQIELLKEKTQLLTEYKFCFIQERLTFIQRQIGQMPG